VRSAIRSDRITSSRQKSASGRDAVLDEIAGWMDDEAGTRVLFAVANGRILPILLGPVKGRWPLPVGSYGLRMDKNWRGSPRRGRTMVKPGRAKYPKGE
jgi:hypothetical protein